MPTLKKLSDLVGTPEGTPEPPPRAKRKSRASGGGGGGAGGAAASAGESQSKQSRGARAKIDKIKVFQVEVITRYEETDWAPLKKLVKDAMTDKVIPKVHAKKHRFTAAARKVGQAGKGGRTHHKIIGIFHVTTIKIHQLLNEHDLHIDVALLKNSLGALIEALMNDGQSGWDAKCQATVWKYINQMKFHRLVTSQGDYRQLISQTKSVFLQHEGSKTKANMDACIKAGLVDPAWFGVSVKAAPAAAAAACK